MHAPELTTRGAQRTLIVYGNCQAEAVAAMLSKYSSIAGRYHVMYLRSFEHPVEGMAELAPEAVASCAVLLEQHDPRPFPYHDRLGAECVKLKFPAVDLNVLWPFNRVNPYNEVETPEKPFGSFPYGDRIIIGKLESGMPPNEVLEYYLQRWDDYGLDLDRLLSLEDARLLARDAHCDVKLGAYVLSAFRTTRLFWTVNHPTMELLLEVCAQLLNAAFPNAPRVSGRMLGRELTPVFGPRGPLGAIDVPIHPKVAEHFGLQWYDASARHQGVDGGTHSYRGYFEAMLALSATRLASSAV